MGIKKRQTSKEDIITEIRRVAEALHTSSVARREFRSESRISIAQVEYAFGTWNQAVQAAGLVPNVPGRHKEYESLPDDEYLQELIRLTRDLGKEPTERELAAKGRFSTKPYRVRWGTLEKACKVAYAKYGFPQASRAPEIEHPVTSATLVRIPQTHKPATSHQRKVQFGEPIDFRGLRFAPINEQGVVYLFGVISRELGFLIESVRTDYPDCEGKRCVDPNKQRWEHVLIEFEYQSSHFREHFHNPENCDLIVCWIHDWKECPLEVLELKSEIKYLPNH